MKYEVVGSVLMKSYIEENKYYIKVLNHEEMGEPAKLYLQKRGINKETIDYWQIGYCPIGSQKYKKMQGRITFPVYNQSGEIVTISGRKIYDHVNGPKYDMYPFSARKTLFGLWQNKEHIRDMNHAAITEGQMDVITAWQQGFKIATSSFGAHGSLDHLAILSRYARNIDILYDSDDAGMKGIEGIRSIDSLGDINLRIKNPFPKGEDLDSWIRNRSGEQLMEALNRDEISNMKNKLNRMRGMVK